MKIKKQHILVSALILALGAAVYLNWQFSGVPLTAPSSKELGAAAYVSKDTKATADEVVSTSQELSPDDKLTAARTERTQAQDIRLTLKISDEGRIYASRAVIYISREYEHRVNDIKSIVYRNISKEPEVYIDGQRVA